MEKELVLKDGSPLAALQMAISGDMAMEKLEKMLELQERWEANEAKKAYVQAMAAFKASPLKIKKDRHVQFSLKSGGITDYHHATLGNVTSVINEALAKHGLSAGWKTTQDQSGITVTCSITHKMGHSESTSLTAGKEQSGTKNDIQAIGSTITYLQRYTLLSLTGLATHDQDDDGKGSEEPVITESQIESIKKALKETKSDENLFLAHIGAESVETIPATKFLLAITSINKKAEQNALKTTDAWKKWLEVKAIDPEIVREWKDPVNEKQCLEYVKKAQGIIDKQNSDGEAS